MPPRIAALTCLAASLLGVGCRTGGHGVAVTSTVPPLPAGATLVDAPALDIPGCWPSAGDDAQLSLPGGVRLLDSEEAFQALYRCFDERGDAVPARSGVDFSRDVIAVFVSFGDEVAPRLERVERLGDTLTAVFGKTAYCGGAPPPEIPAVHALVLRKEPLTLAVTQFTYPHEPCPPDLP